MSHVAIFYENHINIQISDIYFIDIVNETVSKVQNHTLVKYLDDIVSADISLPQPFDDPHETTGDEFLCLFKSIKAQGFDSTQPIKIAIDQNGRPIICDGIHRTLVCLKLGFSSIPCVVVYRALEWWLFKYAIYTQHSNTTNLYQKVNHFDLSLWKSWRIDCDVRAELIYKDLMKFHSTSTNLLGVELACNMGNVSCGLARKGISMRGLDVDPLCIKSAKLLAQMDSIGALFKIDDKIETLATFEVCGYVIDPSVLPMCDFIVCLSLLNHHQTDGRSEEGLEIFKNLALKTNRIYLDCPIETDAVGGGSEFTQPQKVFDWCKSANIGGQGRIVAEIESNAPLMRPLLVWEF